MEGRMSALERWASEQSKMVADLQGRLSGAERDHRNVERCQEK